VSINRAHPIPQTQATPMGQPEGVYSLRSHFQDQSPESIENREDETSFGSISMDRRAVSQAIQPSEAATGNDDRSSSSRLAALGWAPFHAGPDRVRQGKGLVEP